MLGVLGLDHAGDSNDAATTALGVLIDRLIAERNRAREDKDWATADRIRDDIDAAGITLEDGADTTRWSING
jgi:cysteinyl-tRNA synthetase